MRVRTGDATHPHWVVLATSVCRLACDRLTPWGFSVSINEIRGPTAAGDHAVLEIEMQSGDILRIEAGAFDLRVAGWRLLSPAVALSAMVHRGCARSAFRISASA